MRSLLIFSFRIELAVKDAFKQTEFKEVDENYIGIFNLFKHSGKVKGEVAAANKALKHTTLRTVKNSLAPDSLVTVALVLAIFWQYSQVT